MLDDVNIEGADRITKVKVEDKVIYIVIVKDKEIKIWRY